MFHVNLPSTLACWRARCTDHVAECFSPDDENPRARRVVIDTAAHRQPAADYVSKARQAAEAGSLQEARAQLLVANMMMRESGGLEEAAAVTHVRSLLNDSRISETDRRALKKRVG